MTFVVGVYLLVLIFYDQWIRQIPIKKKKQMQLLCVAVGFKHTSSTHFFTTKRSLIKV